MGGLEWVEDILQAPMADKYPAVNAVEEPDEANGADVGMARNGNFDMMDHLVGKCRTLDRLSVEMCGPVGDCACEMEDIGMDMVPDYGSRIRNVVVVAAAAGNTSTDQGPENHSLRLVEDSPLVQVLGDEFFFRYKKYKRKCHNIPGLKYSKGEEYDARE